MFPGESRSFRLPAVATAGTPPMTLEVTTDHGAEQVQVVLSRR